MHKFTITDTTCYDTLWLPGLETIPAVIDPPMYYGGEPELLLFIKDDVKMEWAKEQFERKVHALEMLHKGDAKTSILYHYEEGSEPVPAEEYGCEAGTLARVLIGTHRRCQMLEQVENGA